MGSGRSRGPLGFRVYDLGFRILGSTRKDHRSCTTGGGGGGLKRWNRAEGYSPTAIRAVREASGSWAPWACRDAARLLLDTHSLRYCADPML